MKPKIAITAGTEELRNRPQTTLPASYAKAIEDAGGIPIILPIINQKTNIASLAQLADGFLFTGGDDIHPRYYGEEPLSDLILSPDERTDFEIALLIEVMRLRKALLGICLGAQLINVALGGNLYQDIAAQIPSSLNHRSGSVHKISIKEGTLVYRILGEVKEIYVVSAHHQAVKSVGNGLVVSALSPDDVAEAVEIIDYPFLLGVQWHPERELDNEYSKKLFKAFVERASW